jgi:hypothetical protein
MDNFAEFEMKQMLHAWEYLESPTLPVTGQGSRRRRLNEKPGVGTVHDYHAKRVGDSDEGCYRYLVKETRRNAHQPLGGASFLATIRGDELHACAVEEPSPSNGTHATYVVTCPRSGLPGTCADVKISLRWETYGAYHNSGSGGGSIDSDSGVMRPGSNMPLYAEQECAPAAASTLELSRRAGWVKTSATGIKGLLAPWQSNWVWRDACGRYQQTSRARSDEIRRCFSKKFVEFIGASHLNYMSFCLLLDVMHYVGTSKKFRSIPASVTDRDVARENLRAGRGSDTFNGNAAESTVENKTYFEYVHGCSDRPHDCLGKQVDGQTDMDLFYENDPRDKTNISLRATSIKVCTRQRARA